MAQDDRLSQSFLGQILSWKGFKVSEPRGQQIINEISVGSTPALGYYALISAASLIASLGLVANSAAVVIGAMLVSPLMTPIFGMALGMVRGDTPLLSRAFRAEFGGVFLAVAFGTVFGAMPVVQDVTSEMLSRTVPTLLDLLVAVFAGLAGTLAVLDERISPVLPGVAISTAIVPPLSTCGLCIAMGAFGGAYGAFLLFAANFLAILLISSLAFIIAGLATDRGKLPRKQLIRRLVITGLGFAVVAVVLTHTLASMLEERQRAKIISQVFAEALRKEPTTSLVNAIHKEIKGSLHVLAMVRTPKVFAPDRVGAIQKQLANQLDMPVVLVVRNSLSKDISSTGTTSAVVDPTLDGSFFSDKVDPNVQRIQASEQILREMFSKRPHLLLLDVNLLHLAGEPVVLASVQTPRALLAHEIAEFENAIRKRLKEPNLRLLVQCQVPIDVTSRGRILLGGAHFGKQDPRAQKVGKLVRRALSDAGGYFVSNLDAIWEKDHWQVRAEVFGPTVISPMQVKAAEKQVAAQMGQPVKIMAWSRAELVVTDGRSMPQDQFTREQQQSRAQKPR
jgi:uncharacterized hydrophobic protein (TIGR00271 family)